MSLYVLPENQELIWKTISKVPQFQQMNNTQNEKHIWFRNVIQMFHEKTSPNIDVNQLRQLNKETIQFMMKDLKNQKTFQPLSDINNLGNNSLQSPFLTIKVHILRQIIRKHEIIFMNKNKCN